VILTTQGRIPDVVLAGIKHIRQRFPSMRVSVEVEKPQRPGLQELAVEADVVFYSKSWALVSSTPTLFDNSLTTTGKWLQIG